MQATLSENAVFMNNTLNQVTDGISMSAGNITVKQNVLKSFSRGIWVTGGNAVIEGNTLIPNAYQGAAESYAVSVTNDARAVIKEISSKATKTIPFSVQHPREPLSSATALNHHRLSLPCI